MEKSREIPSKLGIRPPYDPVIPLYAYTLKKPKLKKTQAPPVFIAGLFTIAKTRKQQRCPLTNDKRSCGTYIYNGILLIHKKEHI